MTACLSADDCLAFMEGGPQRPGAGDIHRHLDECDNCRMMMAEAVRAIMRVGPDGARQPLRVLADDERVGGRYQIRRFVARGGMGEVYEAFDDVLGQRVALKTLAITASDQVNAAEGLLREVRIARKVVHPNVYRILELGIHRRGDPATEAIPFLTMDFLDGETLGKRIADRGRLPPSEVLQIARGLAAGLGAIHRAGIVHRDFKSENVFLVHSGEGTERPVVMDFGLARAFQGSLVSAASSSPRLVGTAAYMAPEQLTGQTVTATTDIFALGIVLFEMLTGRLPFSGDSLAAVALSRLQQKAPAPSSLVPDLGGRWDALVERCLEREANRRFTDLETFLRAVDDVEQPQPTRGRVVDRRSLGVVAALAVITIMGASAVGILGRHRRSSSSASPGPSAPAITGSVVASRPPRTEPAPAVLPESASAPIPVKAQHARRVGSKGKHREPVSPNGAEQSPITAASAAPAVPRVEHKEAEHRLAFPAPRRPHPDDLANPF